MTNYFECNLSHDVSFLDPSVREDHLLVVESIERRMSLLQEALELSEMEPEDFHRIAKELFNAFPDIFDSFSPRTLAQDVIDHYDGISTPKRLDFPYAEVVVDAAFVKNEDWVKLRHFAIGGADTSTLMGTNSHKTDRSLYYEKTMKPRLFTDPEAEDNPLFARGHFLEDDVVDAFCKLKGATRIPETRMFRSIEFPAATANIDAIIQMPNGDIYVFEAKTTKAENYFEWVPDKIPASYAYQVRQYPAVLSDPRIKGTYIGCLFTDDIVVGGKYLGSGYDAESFVCRLIERDPDQELYLLETEQNWWDTYVLGGVIPPRSGDPDLDLETLRTYEVNAGKVKNPVMLSREQVEEIVNEYLTINEKVSFVSQKMDDLKKQLDEKKLLLIEALGEHQVGYFDLGENKYAEIKYASPKDKTTIDTEQLKLAYPEVYKTVVRTKPQKPRFYLSCKDKGRDWEKLKE